MNPALSLLGFSRITPTIYLYDPSAAPSEPGPLPPSPSHPDLVILCTWLGGATPIRISKYARQYQVLLPHAKILLLRSTVRDMTSRPFIMQRLRLAKARDIVRNVVEERRRLGLGDDPSAILHVFSHGGCNTAIQLAHAMRSTYGPQGNINTLPLQSVIFDSCPGSKSMRSAMDAFVLTLNSLNPGHILPDWALRATMYPGFSVAWFFQDLGLAHGVNDMRRDLNDEKIFGIQPRRLYLYSKADEMVWWEAVAKHVEEARGKRFSVTEVLFDSAPHCALVMEDEIKYWNAVKDLWEGSNDRGLLTTTALPELAAAIDSETYDERHKPRLSKGKGTTKDAFKPRNSKL